MDGLFDFQRDVAGLDPTVIEVHYPSEPVTITFSAGSVVHHWYRMGNGDLRSCIIAAFHVLGDNPGTLTLARDAQQEGSLSSFLINH